MDVDWSNRDDLSWGLFPPNRRAASDQIPMLITKGNRTLHFKGAKSVWIANSKHDMTKRQFTLQLLLFYEPFDNLHVNKPFINPYYPLH